jgi:hypothetical protein
MTRAVGGTFGNFRGRLGKVTARVVNGETILSARSESFKESKNPKHIEIIYLAVATKSAYNEIVRYSQSLSLPSN